MTYCSDTRGTALRLDPWPFSKEPNPAPSRRELPYLRQVLYQTRGVYNSASSVLLALSSDVIRNRCVESDTEWRFVLPHFSRHIIPLSQFIGQTVSVYSVKRFCREELDLSNGAGFPNDTHVTTQQVTNGSVPVCTRSLSDTW